MIHVNVRVHRLPDLSLLGTLGEDMTKPVGIDVLTTPTAERMVYVIDSSGAAVRVHRPDACGGLPPTAVLLRPADVRLRPCCRQLSLQT